MMTPASHRTATRLRITAIVAAAVALTLASACGGDPTAVDGTAGPSTDVQTTAASRITPPSTTSPPVTNSTTQPPTTEATDTTTAVEPRPTGTVDELVKVAGARLHVRCLGTGDSTVLLIAGLTGDHTSFSGIEPEVARTTRVCSYDRFGTGTSDPPPAVQTFETQSRDLRDALAVLGEPGPFVVVGHSFGGDVAVTFSSMYTAEVAGVLLLDASPSTWNSAVCAVADDGSAGAALWLMTCAMQVSDGNPERLDGQAAFAELGQITSLGDVPMIVITASSHDYTADDFDPTAAAGLTAAWFDGQDDWVSLSTNAQLISVDTGHNVHLDRPDLVLAQIEQLVTAGVQRSDSSAIDPSTT